MLTKENYEALLEKYGLVGSWAIWDKAGTTPKSNTDSMEWVHDPKLLQILNTGFVFVGLNASSTHGDQNGHFENAWTNFHSGYRYQNDYKLRYAFQNTRYWGSYITDVIKKYNEVESSRVRNYLIQHPEVVRDNIRDFEVELSYLGDNPVLVALGGQVYQILNDYLGHKYRIEKIPHFSHRINKENYRNTVLGILDAVDNSD